MLLLVAPALALPLLVERFDATTLAEGWKPSIGAQTGGGKPSAYAVEDGALVFRAEAKTRRFTAVSRKLELRDVSWIRVDARVKTEGVSADASSVAPCGVFVRFEGGERMQAGPCTSSPASGSDWTPSTRYFEVPAGARDVEVGFLLPGAGTAAYDDLIVEPVSPDWKALGRGSFTYHWLGTDAFREDQLVANDEAYDRAIAMLGAAPAPSSPGARIEYHRYGDLETIAQYTGVRTDAHVSGAAIHTIFRNDVVSIMRVLAHAWGDPPPLLAEGLAVSFAGEWDGRELRQASRALASAGTAPKLDTLLDPAAFHGLPPNVAYPVAGAFAQWLVATKGQGSLQALYGQLHAEAPVADNRKALEAALGMTLAEADTALRAWW
ncbi:MAG: hypothetical protein Q8P18_25430 [Pseudomonadota bacterium]|nr:hypothetical protein [Pseudomonadota bacterium]